MPLSIFNPWVIGGAALALMLVAGGAYFYGRGDGRDLCQAEHSLAALKQAEEARRIENDAAKRVRDAEAKAAKATAQIRIVTQTIIRKVPIHVTPEIDRRYPWPIGAQRVHDAAALGIAVSAVPLPAGKSDADPSDIKPSEALGVIASNYGSCRETREQLIGLQDAYTQALIILREPTP